METKMAEADWSPARRALEKYKAKHKRTPLTVWLDEDLQQALKAHASWQKKPMSTIVSDMLMALLKKSAAENLTSDSTASTVDSLAALPA